MTLPRYKIGDELPLGKEKFRVLDGLGRGGFASVYKVSSLKSGKPYAAKLLDVQPGWDEEMVKSIRLRWLQEAYLYRRLENHPRIVNVHSFGEDFIVMELLGACLDEIMHAYNKQLSPKETLVASTQVADGLTALHELRYRHRDLKPANVLTRGTNDAVLADFGLAKSMAGPALTVQGTKIGTPLYWSPEQLFPVRFDNLQDFRTDIYQFGVMSYELLTGTLPFDKPTLAEKSYEALIDFYAQRVKNDKAIQDRIGRPDIPHPADFTEKKIPRRLSNLVMQCLELDPNERPDKIVDVRDGLNRILFELYQDFVIVGSDERDPNITPEILIPHKKTFQGHDLYSRASIIARHENDRKPKPQESWSPIPSNVYGMFTKKALVSTLIAVAALFGPWDSLIGDVEIPSYRSQVTQSSTQD